MILPHRRLLAPRGGISYLFQRLPLGFSGVAAVGALVSVIDAGDVVRETDVAAGDVERETDVAAGDVERETDVAAGDVVRETDVAAGNVVRETDVDAGDIPIGEEC